MASTRCSSSAAGRRESAAVPASRARGHVVRVGREDGRSGGAHRLAAAVQRGVLGVGRRARPGDERRSGASRRDLQHQVRCRSRCVRVRSLACLVACSSLPFSGNADVSTAQTPGRRDGSSRRGRGTRGWPRSRRALAERCAGIAARVGDEPAASSRPSGPGITNGIAALERALDARVTPAGSRLLPECSACAAPASTSTAPLGLELAGDPVLARGHRIGGRQEPGAAARPSASAASGCQHLAGRRSTMCAAGGHGDLAPPRSWCAMPPRDSSVPASPRHRLDLGRDLAHLGDAARAAARVPGGAV